MTTDRPWIDKYRPLLLEGIRGQETIVRTLTSFVQTETYPHLLFYGPPGCGKTTASQCMIRSLYGDSGSLASMILNASNERGIGTVRSKIKAFAQTDTSIFQPEDKQHLCKIVVLDEFDSMTKEAQNVLRQIMENSKYTRFILICNDLEKIDVAIQSRCAGFRFNRLSERDTYKAVVDICQEEDLVLSKECRKTVSRIADGDMRSVLNVLQQLSSLEGVMTPERICQVTGSISLLYWERVYQILSSSASLVDRVNKAYRLTCKHSIKLGPTLWLMAEHIMEEGDQERINRILPILAEVDRALYSQVNQRVALITLASAF